MALHFLIEEPGALDADEVVLTGAEAHHAASVRRVRVGEEVTVGDGRGAWHSGVCESVEPKRVVVRITARAQQPAPAPRLVLVQALAKGDRDERAVQAATELGVDEIMPWQASRSVSRWDGPKIAKGVARWQTIVREAAKQAHRAWVPTVSQPATTAQLVARASESAGARRVLTLVLDPEGETRLSQLAFEGAARAARASESADSVIESADSVIAGAEEIIMIVGPEGGIAPEELEKFTGAGAVRVRLGDTVLRTSTAGPAALSVISVALGRW